MINKKVKSSCPFPSWTQLVKENALLKDVELYSDYQNLMQRTFVYLIKQRFKSFAFELTSSLFFLNNKENGSI
jgi:hypothetical protein